jgi:hypothetical protein
VKRVVRPPLLRLPRGPRDAIAWTVGAAAIAATMGLGHLIGAGSLSAERAAIETERQKATNALVGMIEESAKRPLQERAMQSFVDRTLGSDLDSTDSALRSRLNRIGEELRLVDLSVKTDRATVRASPAKSEFQPRGSQKAMRDEPDFVELPATMSGEGTVDQVLRLVHRIHAEPWIKRLDGVRLEQAKAGERVRMTLRLTTLFLPGKRAKSDPRPSDADRVAIEQSFERFRSLVAANPFRVPAPEKPAPPPTEVAQAPPPTPPVQLGFPYDQWQLTGLVDGPAGVEAWVRNPATGERRELQVGQVIGEIAFAGAQGDIAEFTLGQERFGVQVGSALNARGAIQSR